jgi:tripartite-type tricarboxylate transporter receptor subunit TctC
MGKLARSFAAIACAALAPAPVHAQAYPDKAIRLIVPLVAGSPVTALARVVISPLSARLGQNIVIDNRPGAGTTIGLRAAATSTPDGYTLFMYGQTITYIRDLYPELGFDPLTALVPVAPVVSWSHVLVVGAQVPVTTMKELVAYAKANPGKLNFGFGLGTMPQIVGEYFKRVAGLDIVSVPYKGGEQVRVDILGGRVHVNVGPTGSTLPLIREGKLRPLAYTGKTRHPLLPDVPTMIESGYPQVGFHPDVWQGIFAPAGAPATAVDRLHAEINATLKLPEVRAAYDRLGFDVMSTPSPQAFAGFIAEEAKKWPPIIKATGVKVQ